MAQQWEARKERLLQQRNQVRAQRRPLARLRGVSSPEDWERRFGLQHGRTSSDEMDLDDNNNSATKWQDFTADKSNSPSFFGSSSGSIQTPFRGRGDNGSGGSRRRERSRDASHARRSELLENELDNAGKELGALSLAGQKKYEQHQPSRSGLIPAAALRLQDDIPSASLLTPDFSLPGSRPPESEGRLFPRCLIERNNTSNAVFSGDHSGTRRRSMRPVPKAKPGEYRLVDRFGVETSEDFYRPEGKWNLFSALCAVIVYALVFFFLLICLVLYLLSGYNATTVLDKVLGLDLV